MVIKLTSCGNTARVLSFFFIIFLIPSNLNTNFKKSITILKFLSIIINAQRKRYIIPSRTNTTCNVRPQNNFEKKKRRGYKVSTNGKIKSVRHPLGNNYLLSFLFKYEGRKAETVVLFYILFPT